MRYNFGMSFEKPDELINPHERQKYLERLTIFMRDINTGAVSDETEAHRLHRMLLQNQPVKKSYVEKILGQLGDPDDRGSLYH
jgi:hypothetical protein